MAGSRVAVCRCSISLSFENVQKFEEISLATLLLVRRPSPCFGSIMSRVSVGCLAQCLQERDRHGYGCGNDGKKMSKSVAIYTDPNELMDKFSADSLRFVLYRARPSYLAKISLCR